MKKIILGLIALTFSITGFAQCWSILGGGGDYFVAIKTDGTLWAWGNNNYGQMGNGSSTGTFPTPVQVGTLNNWAKISGGDQHILGIKTDGTLWAWGYNFWGQLGNSLATNQSTPIIVGTDNDWLQAVAGGNNSLALKTNGKIYAWGHNGYGQFGNGTISTTSTPIPPTQVGNDSNWVQIAAGSGHCMALKSNGTLWGWGYNTTGQVGVNSNSNVLVPTQVGSSNNWSKVFCGDAHTFAIKTDGSLWAWGTNNYGQVGNGTTTNQLVPVMIDSIHTWVSITGGASHSLAVTSTGDLYAFGYNGYGELGNGTTASTSTLTQIGSGNSWSSVGAGWYFSEAIRTDGTTWGWGKNNYGQAGIGSLGANVLTPTNVSTIGCSPTGLSIVENKGLVIYPNPTHSEYQLVLSLQEEIIRETFVYSLTGQLVLTQSGNHCILDISILKDGIYAIKVMTNKGGYTLKFVKN